MNENNDNAGNRPVHSVKSGRLEAAVWPQATKEGKVFHSVSFTRSYKTDDGWGESKSFTRRDLVQLAALSLEIHGWIGKTEREAAANDEESPAPADADFEHEDLPF